MMKEQLKEIEELYGLLIVNAQAQIVHNNKSAGIRARKNSLELEKLLKDFRRNSLAFSKENLK